MATVDEETAFAGWPVEALTYFRELAANNNKAFFEAHREIYETAVRGPMIALVDELSGEFGSGKLFRPYRDLRFSKIKTPYHTHVAATLGMNLPASYYVQLTADELFIAAGAYGVDREVWERYRRAVDAEASGTRLEGIVADLEAAGYTVGGETLKRVPQGYAKDHPRARLLRHTYMTISRQYPPEPWLHTPAARDYITQVWRDAAPLVAWLCLHLA